MNDQELNIVVKAKDRASRVMKDVSDETSKLGSRTADLGRRFKSMAAFAAKATAAVAAIGAAAGVAFGKQAIGDAIDFGESINAVEKTFGSASDKILEFGKTADKQAGLSKAAFNSAVVPIGAMLQNMGLSADQAAEGSINLGKTAADLASVFNSDLGEALTAIQAGLRGEADPLERFGVQLNQTAVKAYALEEGIISQGEALEGTALATARLGAFMKQTSKFQGDFIDTSDQAANRQRILEARLINVRAEIGEKLLPIWERMLSVGEKAVDEWLPKLNSAVGAAQAKFQEWWPTIREIAVQVGDYLIPKMKALWATISNDLLPAMQKLWKEVIEPLIPVIGAVLVVAIGAAIDALNILISTVSGVIDAAIRFKEVMITLGVVLGGQAVVGKIMAVRAALVGAGGLKAALASVGAFVKSSAMINPWTVLAAAAVAAFVTIQNKAAETIQTLKNTERAVESASNADAYAIRRANEFKAAGETEKASRILDSIKNRASGGGVSTGRSYNVGERETELFIPNTQGRILNQEQQAVSNNSSTNIYGDIHLHTAEAVDRFKARFDHSQRLAKVGITA